MKQPCGRKYQKRVVLRISYGLKQIRSPNTRALQQGAVRAVCRTRNKTVIHCMDIIEKCSVQQKQQEEMGHLKHIFHPEVKHTFYRCVKCVCLCTLLLLA